MSIEIKQKIKEVAGYGIDGIKIRIHRRSVKSSAERRVYI